MAQCTICGSTRFAPGPKGRMSATGLPPCCTFCGSLERHRVARAVMQAVRLPEKFATYNAIQFSEGPIVPPNWFGSFELSCFGSKNFIGMHNLPRKAARYDAVICCHVIESVGDPCKALQNLTRVLSAEGIIYLTYPSPVSRALTRDWGYPDPNQHGHYRVFGRDFEHAYKSVIPGVTVIAVTGKDVVTGELDLHYLITKSALWKRRVMVAVSGARLVQ